MDVLLADPGRPDGGGHGLLEQLQARHPSSRASRLVADVEKSKERGFNALLEKPVEFQALGQALEMLPAGTPAAGNPPAPPWGQGPLSYRELGSMLIILMSHQETNFALGHPKTLLVVDDDAADREFIEACLRDNGVGDRILSFSSGQGAIRYLAGEGPYADRQAYPYPSIIITDLKMPSGDGFAVLAYLKKHPDYAIIPVLVLSASDDADDIKRAYRMGASAYMRKPQDLGALQATLKAFYNYWHLCELPEVDAGGKQLATEHQGKLGERYGRM